MKRIWTASPSSSQDMLVHDVAYGADHPYYTYNDPPLDTTTAPLKRLRHSVSPGELRLLTDLQELPHYGWTPVNERRWMWRPGGVLLEKTNDPLRMLITFPQQYQVWIQLPRLYPHMAPAVSRVVHPTVRQIHVTLAQHDAPWHVPHDVLVYTEWSPIRQLGDLLRFLVDTLPQHEQQQQQMEEMTICRSPGGPEPPYLSPNRFDQGYDRCVGTQSGKGIMDMDDL